MNCLNENYPWLYQQFTESGYHCVRTEKQWSGFWSDLEIEQTIMYFIKSRGGLTFGRDLTEHSLKKQKDSLETHAILIEVSVLS